MSSGNSILFYFILIFIGFRLLVLAFKGLTGDALLSLSLSPSLCIQYIYTYSETSPESSLPPSLSTFKNKPRKLSLLSRSPFLLFSVYTCIWVVFSVNEL